jgi:hypothetical protein
MFLMTKIDNKIDESFFWESITSYCSGIFWYICSGDIIDLKLLYWYICTVKYESFFYNGKIAFIY